MCTTAGRYTVVIRVQNFLLCSISVSIMAGIIRGRGRRVLFSSAMIRLRV